MRGSKALSTAVALLATVLLTLGAVGGASPAQARAAGDSLQSVESLRGCLETRKQGDILLLLDQSASLATNDPQKARADASIYLAARLADFAARNKVALSLAVAGFDNSFKPVGGWEDVSDGSASATTDALRSVGRNDTGWETDYFSALEGARRYLSEQSAGDPDRCQAIVWFSDGAYDLDVRDTATERTEYGIEKPYLPGVPLTSPEAVRRAEAAGQRAICRKGGLADQLRADEDYLIGIGLQGDGAAKDFDLMGSTATGQAGSATCGKLDGSALGSFALVTEIDELIFIFDGVDEAVPCNDIKVSRTSGAAGACHFVTDPAVRRARILTASGRPSARIELGSPAGGKPAVIRPGTTGSQTLGTVAVAWRPVSATAVEITAEPAALTDPSWTGSWSLGFLDTDAPAGSKARANVHLDGDLAPTLANSEEIDWRVGGVIPDLRFGLVHRGTDTGVDPTEVTSTISFDASLQLPDGTSVPLVSAADAGHMAAPVSVDLSSANTGRAKLAMTLSVTTNGEPGTAGTALPTQVVTEKITLLPPLNYPDVPDNITFGVTEGTGPVAATLPITGTGCVWLEGTTVTTSPALSEPVSVTAAANSAPNCVGAGATPSGLTLELTTTKPDNGAIWGTAVVKLAPAQDPGAAVTKVVQFSAEVRKRVNVAYRWWLAILLTVLGIVGPLALLYWIAWWQGRIPPTGLLVGWLDLEVRDDQVVRRGYSAGLTATSEDFHFVGVSPPGQRRLELGTTSLRVTTRNPLDPHVVVDAAGLAVRTRSGGNRLPLAVAGHWALVIDPAGYLRLLVILPGTATPQERDAVLADAASAITRFLPDLKLPAHHLADSEWDPGASATAWDDSDGFSDRPGPATPAGPTAGGRSTTRTRRRGKAGHAPAPGAQTTPDAQTTSGAPAPEGDDDF
jgi:hypothetical protein